MLEASRLDELKSHVWSIAMSDDPAALHAAATYAKLAERLASLIGLNAPIGHVINVIGSAPEIQADNRTSTQRMLDAIRQLRGESDPSDDDEPKLN